MKNKISKKIIILLYITGILSATGYTLAPPRTSLTEMFGSNHSIEDLERHLSLIQSSFIDQLNILMPGHPPNLCVNACFALAKILSDKFNIPLGGNSPTRIEFEIGMYYFSSKKTYKKHMWICLYKEGKKYLYIDPTFDQFSKDTLENLHVLPYTNEIFTERDIITKDTLMEVSERKPFTIREMKEFVHYFNHFADLSVNNYTDIFTSGIFQDADKLIRLFSRSSDNEISISQ